MGGLRRSTGRRVGLVDGSERSDGVRSRWVGRERDNSINLVSPTSSKPCSWPARPFLPMLILNSPYPPLSLYWFLSLLPRNVSSPLLYLLPPYSLSHPDSFIRCTRCLTLFCPSLPENL
jgi:hypothetical protein